MTPDAETEEFSGRGFLFPNAFSLSRVFITAALGGVVTQTNIEMVRKPLKSFICRSVIAWVLRKVVVTAKYTFFAKGSLR